MAAGWITQINNFSDFDFVVRTNDPTWRPIIGGKQYAVDEAISVPRRRKQNITLPLPPPLPPITIPAGPTVVNVQYAMIGWVDFARTRIEGPGGSVDVLIGPEGVNDFLRFFDDQQRELGSVELGPRGPGSIASVDFHLNIYNPTPTPGQTAASMGVHFLWWNQNGVGSEILKRIDDQIGKAATAAAGGLISTLIKALFA
jgi:hypothetical protein